MTIRGMDVNLATVSLDEKQPFGILIDGLPPAAWSPSGFHMASQAIIDACYEHGLETGSKDNASESVKRRVTKKFYLHFRQHYMVFKSSRSLRKQATKAVDAGIARYREANKPSEEDMCYAKTAKTATEAHSMAYKTEQLLHKSAHHLAQISSTVRVHGETLTQHSHDIGAGKERLGRVEGDVKAANEDIATVKQALDTVTKELAELKAKEALPNPRQLFEAQLAASTFVHPIVSRGTGKNKVTWLCKKCNPATGYCGPHKKKFGQS